MNLYDYTTPQNGETFNTLLEHKNIKIVRIVSSCEVDSKIYIQDEDEWVVVLEGVATLDIEGSTKELFKGDSIFIPSKVPHRVMKTQKGTVWLGVYID